MHAGPTSVPAPPRRRWLWPVLAALAVAAGPALYFAHWQYELDRLDRELQAVIDELDRTDPKWRLHEIEAARQPLPNEENAVVVVLAVYAKFTANLPAQPDPAWEGFQLKPRFPFEQHTEQEQAYLQSRLRRMDEALAEAYKLAKYSQARFPRTWLPNSARIQVTGESEVNSISFLLADEAAVHCDQEKLEAAWKSCQLHYHLSTLLECDFTEALWLKIGIRRQALMSMERTLAQGEVKGEALADLQQMLQNDIRQPTLRRTLRGERAKLYFLWSGAAAGEVPLTDNASPTRLDQLSQFTSAVFVKRQIITSLQIMTEAVEAARQAGPNKQWQALKGWDARAAEWDEQLRTNEGSPISPALHLPVRLPGIESYFLSDADVSCAVCGLACERYRLKHQRWPASLDELITEKLLQEVPVDPFDGKPLRYRQTKSGVVVYSVGPQRAYGGERLDNPDFQNPHVSGWSEFRLWNPDQRRQPPQPRRHFRVDQ